MSVATYYRPQGWLSPSRLAVALLVACPPVAAAGAAYIAAMHWCPWIYGNVLLAAAFGGALGLIAGKVQAFGHVRHPVLAALVPLVCVAAGTWVQWVCYLRLMVDDGAWRFSVQEVWPLVQSINRQGLWTFKSTHPTGVTLWLVWLAELAIIGEAAWLVARSARVSIFCEGCQGWATQFKALGPFHTVTEPAAMRAALEAGVFHRLGDLRLCAPAQQFAFAELVTCPSCSDCNVLTVSNAVMVQGEKALTRQDTPIVKELMVPRAVVHTLLATPAATS